jgi:hypothetical protein
LVQQHSVCDNRNLDAKIKELGSIYYQARVFY